MTTVANKTGQYKPCIVSCAWLPLTGLLWQQAPPVWHQDHTGVVTCLLQHPNIKQMLAEWTSEFSLSVAHTHTHTHTHTQA